jgi:hypothetical protein
MTRTTKGAAEGIKMRKLYSLMSLCVVLLASCVQTPVIEPGESQELVLESQQRFRTTSPLGTNLSGVSPFTNDYPFINAFRSAREWTAYTGSSVVELDANGWVKNVKPGQGLFTQLFNRVNGLYPGGDYILLYDGEGDLSVGDDAVAVGTATRSGNTTRQVIRVTPRRDNPATAETEDKGISLGLTRVNPSNYVRNIRLIMPGGTCTGSVFRYAASAASSVCTGSRYVPFEQVYQSRTFHPLFLRSLLNYSTIRLMTWQETNGSIQTTWSGRPKVTDATWATKKGVPLEVMIDLANTLDVDAWFNMPHAADNTYVTEFAKLTKSRLEPGRKVYLEYSNEVWLDRGNNPDDAQFDYAVAQGKRLGLVTSSECSQLGTPRCNALNGNRFYVKRSLEVFALWQGASGSTNLIRVMGSTMLTPPYVSGAVSPTRELLRYQNAYTKIDALAVAPYFGDLVYDQARANFIKGFTLSSYFTRLNGELLNEMRQDIRAQKATIASFNSKLPLIAYEGGQILTQENVTDVQVDTFFDDVNRDPRMKQTYLTYLTLWKTEGGQLYNHFVNSGNWTKFGRWGALEYLTQPRSRAPKWDAIQTFIETTPRWW